MQEEIWKDIPNYEGIYQVSNLGNVKSVPRKKMLPKNNMFCFSKEKILKPSINTRGYLQVVLCSNTERKTITIHMLVAVAFLNHSRQGNNGLIVIDHINEVKTDNRVDNLQITTQRINIHKSNKNKTSLFIGVSKCNRVKKWRAQISIGNRKKYIGSFNTEIEAHNAYLIELKKIKK